MRKRWEREFTPPQVAQLEVKGRSVLERRWESGADSKKEILPFPQLELTKLGEKRKKNTEPQAR